jgi:hypothetical protein
MEPFNLSRSEKNRDSEYKRQFSHEDDLVDLSNKTINEIAFINPTLGAILQEHSQSYMPLPGFIEIFYGHKKLRIPRYQFDSRLIGKIGDANIIKDFFHTSEQLANNRENALRAIQGYTLSHTDRPKSATTSIQYSSGSGQTAGYEKRQNALIPKFDRFITENVEELSQHPDKEVAKKARELRIKEGQKFFWDLVLMRAVLDEEFYNENESDFNSDQKTFITRKKQFLEDLCEYLSLEDVIVNIRSISMQFLAGFERKYDLEKIHTMKLVQTPGNWYAERDVQKLIMDYYKKHSVQ